jgi:hypothetical protein
LLFAVPGGAARAATPQLPITGLTQVIADSVHNELFLSTGTNVVVTDLTGGHITTWGAGAQAGGMATDGTNVYVANGGVVDAFSAVTPTAAPAPFALGAGDVASSVAFQFNRIWVSYSHPAVPVVTGAIGYFNVGSNTFHPSVLSATGTWPTAPRLAADPNPATEGTLVAVDNEADPTMVATYNVSGNAFSTAPVGENDALASCTGLSDVALAAGGAHFLLACSGGNTSLGFTSADPAVAPYAAADYPSGASPDAVAVAPDNSGFATGTNDGTAPALKVFKGAGTVMTSLALAGVGETVAPGGLAWANDAVKLYAVLTNGANFFLDTLVYPQYLATNLDLVSTNSTTTLAAGVKVTFKGTLSYENATGTGITIPPVGTFVRILRGPNPLTTTATLYVKTVAGGAFTVADTPNPGTYYYTAYYPGTGTNSKAWHPVLVPFKVVIAHTTLKVTTSSTLVKKGTTVTVTAHLAKWHTNKTVTIYGRVGTSGGWTALRRALVSPTGILTVSVKVSKKMQFYALYQGDAWYAKVTAPIVTVNVH